MRRPFPLLLCLALAACTDPGPPPGGSVAELARIDAVVGAGAPARAGDEVTVHYTGWLYDEAAPDRHGARFDSSRERGEPLTFLLGAGRVIRGWDEGVAGMRVGGRRTLLVPAVDAYGRAGAGGVIPPNASLVFDVELLDVAAPAAP
ncbi:FKBP-type peptidyl-prolyl cis-trans isomerase [Coralloluteibacterium stylophorae]|uniref:Peptidyl-prolyl cis-trans isomerase n=1 Tax=Coralloluteibacterium stylophorae TaxID=1776034 RepID=A0A8J7VUB1_9GAMM|nr:FKBP-type peptidyl-prolyl cis-trans isomerase [Coralloluteibacterium stylophorae]MBS7457499.1 FKBP-type peptidyl-prolyl cis-trans isomerase [Coralloluteibacterium stylophorae]